QRSLVDDAGHDEGDEEDREADGWGEHAHAGERTSAPRRRRPWAHFCSSAFVGMRASRPNARLASRPRIAAPKRTAAKCWWPSAPGAASTSAPASALTNSSGRNPTAEITPTAVPVIRSGIAASTSKAK